MAAACGSKATVEGVISDAPSTDVVVKLLNINRYEILDTVKTDASGRFTYKVEVEKGQPEFVYLFHKNTKVASLLLEAGDKVSFEADTLGHYTVSGSEESEKLAQVEKNHAEAISTLAAITSQAISAGETENPAVKSMVAQAYLDHYRNCLKYVMQNSRSLTIVPVLFQNLGEGLPVFSQNTDAILFRNSADSLATVYPDSKYVKALRKEADRRFGYMTIESHLRNAQEVGYVDIVLPDMTSQKKKLSEVDAKVIMVYFWSATDTEQKMFNNDVLKSLYEDYHKKGFEIYQVSLDVDKAAWARVIKAQNLPWINVCDSRGAASPYVTTYNLASLPAAFLLNNGELVDGAIVDEKSFRKVLDKLMK